MAVYNCIQILILHSTLFPDKLINVWMTIKLQLFLTFYFSLSVGDL